MFFHRESKIKEFLTAFADILTIKAKYIVPLHIELNSGCSSISPDSDLQEFVEKTEESFSIPHSFYFEQYAKVCIGT